MGNNAKKKVRSLPPLGKESKSRGKKKPEVSFQQVTNGEVEYLLLCVRVWMFRSLTASA